MLICCRIASGKYVTPRTYAGALYLAGARPGYVAMQLGHAETGVVFKVYSKWIDGSDHQSDRAKLGTAFVHHLCTARSGNFITN